MPTWAYLVVVAQVAQHAQSIAFGEEKNPVPVFARGPQVNSVPVNQ